LIGPSQREKKTLSKLPLSPTIKVIIYGEIYKSFARKPIYPSQGRIELFDSYILTLKI
jgi:hypothetical protein